MNGHLLSLRESTENDDLLSEIGALSGRGHHQQLPCGLSDLIQKALDQLTDLQEAMEEDSDDECDNNEYLANPTEEEEEDAAMMGYRFCAEETIRFLIEEEHFSPDDPVIKELQQHLDHQQVKLQQICKHDVVKDVDNNEDGTIKQTQDIKQLNYQEISPENQSCSSEAFESTRHDTQSFKDESGTSIIN